MFELLLKTGEHEPAPEGLNYGTMNAGFFKTLTASELIDPLVLAEQIGLKTGIVVPNIPNPWLKIAYKGKVCYYATRAFRRSITYDSIYNCGAAYDSLGDQGDPPHLTKVEQKAIVIIDGKRYSVRQINDNEWKEVIMPLGTNWVPSLVSQMNIGNFDGAARWTLNKGMNASYRCWRGWTSLTAYNPSGTASNTAPTSSGWAPLLVPID